MGNMSEEMKKIMAKWNATDSQVDQPTNQGANMQTTTPETVPHYRSYRAELYDIIKNNPGVSCVEALEKMNVRHPELGHSSVSSQLTTMFHEFMLTRESKFEPRLGRRIYFYSAVDLKQAEAMRKERDKKLAQAQARAERARQVKAERAKERQKAEKQQIALPFNEPHTITVSASAQPSTMSISDVVKANNLRSMTAVEILQAINFSQAKELYKELKEAFGG